MGLKFPYTYISCPCSDRSNDDEESRLQPPPLFHKHEPNESQEDEAPFDPHHPRSNFSLFPPEHLLYCEECRDLKCPRCVTEEQVSYYCTSCLFETPSSAVRSEGNRCARNCFNCPICFSQLTVNSMNAASKDGPWILHCNYCMWTSLDIGIKFDRPTNIRAQLDKIANGGKPKPPSKPVEDFRIRPSQLSREPYFQTTTTTTIKDPSAKDQDPTTETRLDLVSRFAALKSFYKNQVSTSAPHDTTLSSISGDFSYSSPASLTRILNLYSTTTSGTFQPTKKKPKPPLMREAVSTSEGLLLSSFPPSTTTTTHPTNPTPSFSFSHTPTLPQLHHQTTPSGGNPSALSTSDLRPLPAPLTTKRSHRCLSCRHILLKPEPKPTSTRHRIKLVALSYIPSVTLQPLPPTHTPTARGSPLPPLPGLVAGSEPPLDVGKPTQFILTLQNPLFEPVKVSLATPAVTPGRRAHKVTVLCPSFGVGRRGDVWEEVLGERREGGKKGPGDGREGGDGAGENGGARVAEAGKVYERGRDWTSVVLEVVPVGISKSGAPTQTREEGGGDKQEEEEDNDDDELAEDDDVLEIPVRVRLEWRQGDLDQGAESPKAKRKDEEGGDDARRELAYWMILGLGRVKM